MGILDSTVTIMRTAASDAGYQLYIIGDQDFGYPPAYSTAVGLLDAITNYDVYGSMGTSGYATHASVDAYYAAQAGWKSLAQSLNVGFIPGTTPEFNDTGVRTGHSPLSRRIAPADSSGSLFRTMFLGAKALVDSTVGNIIMVTSWNEWHEDTQIEPVSLAPVTSQDNSLSGHDYTRGLSYEGYSTLYLDILREVTTSVQQNSVPLPKAFILFQNFPNPFNPVTTIFYDLPKSSDVTLSIYDITGRLVQTLVNQHQNAGTYQIQWDASGYSSGVYFYQIKADGFQQVKKMLLIK